jgi:hypothetical protein
LALTSVRDAITRLNNLEVLRQREPFRVTTDEVVGGMA